MRVWNTIGYLLYAGLVVAGGYAIWLSLFFTMATDGCHDPGCDASYHVWPAMLTVWIGVAATLLLTLAVMIARSVRSKVVVGWPFVGLLGVGIIFVVANDVVLH